MHLLSRCVATTAILVAGLANAADRAAPPGMFKDLDDAALGDAIIVQSKQLFIDDHLIESLDGAVQVLNQPVKHASNPLIVRDRPSDGTAVTYGSVLHDPEDGQFKLWYQIYHDPPHKPDSELGYATSRDGVTWEKRVVDPARGDNIVVFDPAERWIVGAGVMLDAQAADPARRFKMLYSAQPDGTAKSLSTVAAYSADGLRWTPEPANPLIPFSDTQANPFWDESIKQYVAYLRYGPPNVRHISRIQSEDFVHWSPKVTVIKPGPLDAPYSTQFYMMTVAPYAGIYVGLICAYHGETIQPIPEDQLWMDRKNLQLVYSRNGLTWQRVGAHGAYTAAELQEPRDWRAEADGAAFLPNGSTRGSDWDWGVIHPVQGPLVVGDEIRIYYQATSGRNWWNYHKDANNDGYGLATLRLDGFVSVDAAEEGTLTTKPLVFIGDTLQVNANAAGGNITVEALDVDGQPIEGFSADTCRPLTTDDVRHVVTWNDDPDCHVIQGRPIRLRFRMERAKLYSFEPRVLRGHYIQAYE